MARAQAPTMKITRSIVRVAPILVAFTLAACSSAQEKAVDADNARAEADDKMAVISLETQQQEAEVQRKAAEESDRIAREGAQKLNAADTVAYKKAVEA